VYGREQNYRELGSKLQAKEIKTAVNWDQNCREYRSKLQGIKIKV
jgi:hypothetical protein